MRSSGCSVPQLELAEDTVAVMRQAVSLALHRGHPQVTTLHVASAVLSDPAGLLRTACLRSRASSHPVQCMALEVCFNVALDILAMAGRPAMFQSHAQHGGHRAPALSNALAAAFKRAQANQRRGGPVSNEEGLHVAPKVELKHVVISILDDPSVSRVMREAGFSSAEVQANVEKAITSSKSNTASSSTTSPNACNPKESLAKADRVLDYMASGMTNRCVVVLDDSAAAAEAVVKAAMDKVSKGQLRRQHERLRNAQFVPFSAASFQHMPREEVEACAGDLRTFVRECRAAGKGVVLVLEDLGYAAEAWTAASWKRGDHRRVHCLDYCPVEHAVVELSSLVRGNKDNMFWLLGFGAYASYSTNCRSGEPSLETVLELYPIFVPNGTLALSRGGDSSDGVSHCGTSRVLPTAASVPLWIGRCHGAAVTGSEHTPSISAPDSASSHSGFIRYDTQMGCKPWHDQLSLVNPNPGYSSSLAKSNRPKFTELTAENLKILCSALQMRIPRHRDIALGIASAVLQRRSGVTRTARPTSATWLLFQGRDNDGKMAMAQELARVVFGSYAEFTCIGSPSVLALDSSTVQHNVKRRWSPGNDENVGCMQMFFEAIRKNPHRVVLIDGVVHDSKLEAAIMNAMVSGTARGCYGGVVSLEDSIVVCSEVVCESRSPRASSPPRLVKQRITSDVVVDGMAEEDEGAEKGLGRQAVSHYFSLDLNAGTDIDDEGEEGSSWRNAVEILSGVDGVFFFNQ